MTFKTRPHRYTIGLAPTSRARCRGCRRLVANGELRLAIHAFVRPNRGTTFTQHLTVECMGVALAADVLSAEGVRHGVRIDKRLTIEAAGLARALVEAQAKGVERSSRCCGKVDGEVRGSRQPVIRTMFGHFGRVEAGGCEQKEDA